VDIYPMSGYSRADISGCPLSVERNLPYKRDNGRQNLIQPMEDSMNKIILAMAAILLVSINLPTAQAGDRALNGLLIGGSGGALLGQGIGRNTESTLIGATVGGVLGMIVGNEFDRTQGHYHQPRVSERHVYHHQPRVRERQVYHYRPRVEERHVYHHYPPRGKHHKMYSRHQPQEFCTETVIIKEGKHRDKRVIKRECRKSHQPQQHFSRHRPGQGYYR
jgi:hypothetical protein